MIDFAVLPTFSTSYTLERSTSNMSIMPEVGPVAKTAQFEIVTRKQSHVRVSKIRSALLAFLQISPQKLPRFPHEALTTKYPIFAYVVADC